MQCYTEVTPPTAVTHCLTLPLVSPRITNLVVAKSSLLQIFSTKVVSVDIDNASDQTYGANGASSTQDNEAGLAADGVISRADRGKTVKLELVTEIPLSGTVTGMARIKTPSTKSGGEMLLLAFEEARLSLVEWDPEIFSISTVSIHYYEQDDLRGSPWNPALSDCYNFLAADPGSRCAALKFGPRNLAILPFTQGDEDMDMNDWDEELDGPRPAKEAMPLVNGAATIEETPYSPSFVLRLPNLDAALAYPVHLAFLHQYKEPTFAIISSHIAPSTLLGRKDQLVYMVFTLDLQQKASTTILSVAGLPSDLFQIVPVPAPVGGALLVGANELIHIDQSGKSNGVAVNVYTKQSTNFALGDQSHLGLRLEGCHIDVLAAETGELLMTLSDGRLVLITFRKEGRTVSGLNLKVVSPQCGGTLVPEGITRFSRISRNSVFLGSDYGDSVVLGFARKQSQASRRKSQAQDVDMESDDEGLLEDEDDDDDLYAEGPSTSRSDTTNGTAKGGELVFRIHDRLISIAPIRDMTYGKPWIPEGAGERADVEGIRSDLQLACAVGKGKAGALAVLNREIQPNVVGRFDFSEARGLWTMRAAKPIPKAAQTKGEAYETPSQHDKFMIVAKEDMDGFESSDVYAVTSAGFESLSGTEFDPAAGFTIEAGTMAKHTRLIQVLKSQVRVFDGDFGLSQIVPMENEETGHEPRALSASIADPYILIIRDDSSIAVYGMDKDRELDELERMDRKLVTTKWLSGCLYSDTNGVFGPSQSSKGDATEPAVMLFLLSGTGTFYIYALPNLSEPVFVTEGLGYIPFILDADYTPRRGTVKDTVTEVLVANLGDTTAKSPYLILRHSNDDLTVYQPYRISSAGENLTKGLKFKKMPNDAFAKSPVAAAQDDSETQPRNMPLRALSNVGGYSTVFLPGASPSFIIKTAKSQPKIIGLQGTGVRALSSFHTEGCEAGFIYANSGGIARVSQIPRECCYSELGMSLRKVPLGADVSSIAHHPPTNVYAIASSVIEEFELPKDDDHRKEWRNEQIIFKPTVERGVLKLVNPSNWSVIDTVELEPCEIIMCIKTLNLEVSESTNERRQLIVVGTGISKGEDLAIKGRIYVYDIAQVIPERGRPETNKKFKLVAKEDIPRGAVTAISEIGTQGLMLVAQGQKCLVRGLKEDGTLLPVAFMDMNCYVTAARELPGTGLIVMSDAFKGVWFTGYTEEPYKMMLLGKSNTQLEALNVDLLPDNKDLFIIAADADGNIHVLQFDPEHPKSLQGHLLLHRTTFSTGAHIATNSLLLPTSAPNNPSPAPKKPSPNSPPPRIPQHLLFSSPTGVLSTLHALTESDYRRLSSLAAQLLAGLPHAAGLNPKEYRQQPSGPDCGASLAPGVDAAIGRAMVDGALLRRWGELAAGRRAEIAGRVGFDGGREMVRGVLEGLVGWGCMSYF